MCAVVGGTGFIGSHLVDELLRRKKYHIPNADCLIQVDMLDLDGLTSTFQGVDSVIHSVIHSATFFPTAYSTPDEAYGIKKMTCGQWQVKTFF